MTTPSFGSWILENGVVADDLMLSLGEARRLAVRSQHLAGPPPTAGIDGMRQVLRGLRVLQIDPVNVVARSHLLVLWSRLGGFDRDDLDTLLWRERWLFEYWAHAASIVLTEDYPIHRVMMRTYGTIEDQRMREWLAANDDFRRYVLDRLRDAGPLPGDAIEDRSVVSWTSTGWTNGRNVERMLDTLWKQGVITVAGRDGLRRLWGLADFPAAVDLPREESVTQAAGHALRALGVARARDVERHFTIGRYPGLDLERMAWARPVRVEGGSEQWWAHRDTLGLLDEDWRPRTTLLSPFDNLICDRDRTERLWDFRLPQRDVRAEAQAALRQLRDAGAGGGAADRPGGAADGPQAGRTRRGGSVRRGGFGRVDGGCPGGVGDRIAGVVRRRRFGSLPGPGGTRRILSTGESAGRSRRAQAR